MENPSRGARNAGAMRWLKVCLLAALFACSSSSDSPSSDGFRGAVGRNDVSAVVSMLRAGQDPNEGSVLVVTARTGSVEMVAALLAAGANPNITAEGRTETPLHAASQRSFDDAGSRIVSLLLAAGADPCTRISSSELGYFPGDEPMEYRGLSSIEIASIAGSVATQTALALSGWVCDP